LHNKAFDKNAALRLKLKRKLNQFGLSHPSVEVSACLSQKTILRSRIASGQCKSDGHCLSGRVVLLLLMTEALHLGGLETGSYLKYVHLKN